MAFKPPSPKVDLSTLGIELHCDYNNAGTGWFNCTLATRRLFSQLGFKRFFSYVVHVCTSVRSIEFEICSHQQVDVIHRAPKAQVCRGSFHS